tara:strand:- start:862 stop:1197 length:336 start_codon:yes stop_codon:yes gene_type:complete
MKKLINKELLFANAVSLIAVAILLFLAAALMISGCAHIGLPDRSKCVIPWEERKTCVADSDCAPDQVCAFRGRAMGKCTLLDCCDPWRNRNLETGKNWCSHEEEITSGSQQ